MWKQQQMEKNKEIFGGNKNYLEKSPVSKSRSYFSGNPEWRPLYKWEFKLHSEGSKQFLFNESYVCLFVCIHIYVSTEVSLKEIQD